MECTRMPTSSGTVSKTQTFFRRAISTLLLWGLVITAFASMRPWAHLLLISTIMILATVEYFTLTKKSAIATNGSWSIALCFAFCVGMFFFFLDSRAQLPLWMDGMFIFLAVAGSFIGQLRYPIKGHSSLLAMTAAVLGLLWIPWLFSFTARIEFAVRGVGALPGAPMLLWCLAVTKFSDMGAYLSGSLMGKNKMIPHVSPGKTWEGFAGALVFPQLVGILLFLYMPGTAALFHDSWLHVVLLALVVGVLAVLGDLAESFWKRALDVKDSGHLLPGIGGALDLIDSLCFTAPAVYFYLILTH
jgi:phosphatidate cytidylyltransferase